jgi:hypothetical protein
MYCTKADPKAALLFQSWQVDQTRNFFFFGIESCFLFLAIPEGDLAFMGATEIDELAPCTFYSLVITVIFMRIEYNIFLDK